MGAHDRFFVEADPTDGPAETMMNQEEVNQSRAPCRPPASALTLPGENHFGSGSLQKSSTRKHLRLHVEIGSHHVGETM